VERKKRKDCERDAQLFKDQTTSEGWEGKDERYYVGRTAREKGTSVRRGPATARWCSPTRRDWGNTPTATSYIK